jgi:hypothetical protein
LKKGFDLVAAYETVKVEILVEGYGSGFVGEKELILERTISMRNITLSDAVREFNKGRSRCDSRRMRALVDVS